MDKLTVDIRKLERQQLIDRIKYLEGELEWIGSAPMVDEMEPGHYRVMDLEARHDSSIIRARNALDESKG